MMQPPQKTIWRSRMCILGFSLCISDVSVFLSPCSVDGNAKEAKITVCVSEWMMAVAAGAAAVKGSS